MRWFAVTVSATRLGAATAVVFGLSLAAVGVASADQSADTRGPSAAAGSDPAPAGSSSPARATRPPGRTRIAGDTPRIAASVGKPTGESRIGHRGAAGAEPAVVQVVADPQPAAGVPATTRLLPGAAIVGPDTPTNPSAPAAPASPANPTELSSPVLPGNADGPFPTWAGAPTPSSAVRPAPAPVPAPAVAVSTPATAVQRLIDAFGAGLNSLPPAPVTDLLSGALLLVRRSLAPAGGTPTCGGVCPGQLLSSAEAPGHVLTVTNRVDGEAGSLRDVLGRAAAGDVIRFAPRLRHATLKLTQGELDVNVSVRIEGTRQTLDAQGLSRVMRLDEPGTSITVSGLTFANGVAPGDPYLATTGGAILAEGVALDISGSRFVGNTADATQPAQPGSSFMQAGLGGAIAAFNSTLSITDSEFSGNMAAGADNDIDQQASVGLGGAIFASDSTIVLERSRFVANTAVGGSGSTPIESFPTSDGAWGAGGAIFSQGGPVSATNVTFERNSAAGGNGLDGAVSNPFDNEVGAGGRGSAGALWVQGLGRDGGDPVAVELNGVEFARNTATGGAAGSQGLATLAAKQGGRAVGGAFGTVEWVTLGMTDVTFVANTARGGGSGPNAPGAGPNTGTGGVAQGGAAYVESPASMQATRLSFCHNTSQGGTGSNSAPGSGTEAGEGGFGYGGGMLMYNATGTGIDPGVVIPVGIRDTSFVGNRALGGQTGEGPQPELGGGGLAQGGGMVMIAVFQGDLVGLRFIGNSAVAGPGKPAYGGGLINPFAEPRPGQDGRLSIQNSVFRNNSAVGGADAADVEYRQTAGGGFYNNGAGTVISGTRFVGNSAVGGNDTGSGHLGSALGGAIFSLGRDPSFTTFDSTFLGNSAVGGRRVVPGESTSEDYSGLALGGAVHSADGTTTINGGSFLANRAMVRAAGDHTARGGAIDIADPPDGYVNHLITTGARFVTNVAQSRGGSAGGGAVALGGDTFTDNGSSFRYNVARSWRADGSAYGGALLIEQTSQLTGTSVTHNRAAGAHGFGGGAALPNGPDVLTQVQTTVRGNAATTAGDDVWWPPAD